MDLFKHRAIPFLYKWLPIVMGCHCRPDRSFHVKGVQMPVCARCEGQIIGFLCAIPIFPFYKPAIPICLLLAVPMIVDGTVQGLTDYESNNRRRLLTGMAFGYAVTTLIVRSMVAVFLWGYAKGAAMA